MLKAILQKEIQEQGPLSQGRFMEFALSHPQYGYYCHHKAIGRDFTTAPEVSQLFGELIGIWALDYYEKLEHPPSLPLVELGPGKGTLMADFLRVASLSSSFQQALSLHLVEVSPSLKKIQKKSLSHPSILWHETFDEIPSSEAPLIIIANEFFDALPTNCYVRMENTLYERCIGLKEGRLSFILNPLFKDKGPNLLWEESPKAEALINEICKRLSKQGGAFLCLDYGYEKGEGESLQALFNGNPCSPFTHLGDSDLSCHVNFKKLKECALTLGLEVFGPIPQGHFLKNMGIDLRAERLKYQNPTHRGSIEAALTRLTHPQHMGQLFKVMAIFSKASPTPSGFQ